MKKTIIHIEAGDKNWTPTTRELTSLTRNLRKCLKATAPDDTAVFTTRNGVKVTVIEFDPIDIPYVTSGYAQVIPNLPNLGPMTPYTVTTTNTGAFVTGNQQ